MAAVGSEAQGGRDECIGNGCGGLRMCDRDGSGAGVGLGCEGSHALTVPLSTPQPLRAGQSPAHLEDRPWGPSPPTPLSSSQSRKGVSFFVGDACKSVDKHTPTSPRQRW